MKLRCAECGESHDICESCGGIVDAGCLDEAWRELVFGRNAELAQIEPGPERWMPTNVIRSIQLEVVGA